VLGIVGFMYAFVAGIAGLASEGLGTLPYEATSFCTADTSGGGGACGSGVVPVDLSAEICIVERNWLVICGTVELLNWVAR